MYYSSRGDKIDCPKSKIAAAKEIDTGITQEQYTLLNIKIAEGTSKLEIAYDGKTFTNMTLDHNYKVLPGITKVRATSSYGSDTQWYYANIYQGTYATDTRTVPSGAFGTCVMYITYSKGPTSHSYVRSWWNYALGYGIPWDWQL